MVSLMRRRRELMQAASAVQPEWDYEWEPAMGLLEDNGWAKVINGSASTRMVDNGERLTSPTSGYVTLRNPDRFNVQTGVMEVTFYCTGFVTGKETIRFCLSNGNSPGGGIQIKAPGGQLLLVDSSTPASGTSLGATLAANTTYTIRLTLHGNTASVSLDGTVLADHISFANILYTANTSIWSQNADWYGLIIKRVKMKLNRTE